MSKNRTTLRQFLLRKIHPVDIAKSLDRIIFSPFFQKKIFLWIVTIALSLVFFIPTIPSYRSWDVDSPSYYMAARGILQHVNIYDDQQFQQLADDVLGKSRVVLPYIYWPFLAQLFTPLSFFSISDFFVILQIFNTLLTFLGLVLVFVEPVHGGIKMHFQKIQPLGLARRPEGNPPAGEGKGLAQERSFRRLNFQFTT